MRKRIDVIKAVRAREAFRAEKGGPLKPPPQEAPVAPASPAPAPPSRSKASSGTAGLLARIILAALFILGLIYAANEAMVYLLK